MNDPELNEALNTSTSSDAAKVIAFVQPPSTVAGLALRPFTAGTLAQLMMTGNKLIEANNSGDDVAFHVLGFLFIHAGDIATVRVVVMDKAKFAAAVWEFADKLTVKDFVAAAEEIKGIINSGVAGLDYEVAKDGKNESPN